MTRKKMVLKIIKAIKVAGYKFKLPVTATLAKAHMRGGVTGDFMTKLGAKYLRSSGCTCCYTGSMYELFDQEIEIAHGYLFGIKIV